jgi:hypothetical protein
MAGRTHPNAASSCVQVVVDGWSVPFGVPYYLVTSKKVPEQRVLSAAERPLDARRYELWCDAQKEAALLSRKPRSVYVDRFGNDEIEYHF